MKEKPVLLKVEDVRSVLEGRKTQMRFIMKPQPVQNPHKPGRHWWSCNKVQCMVDVENFLVNDYDDTVAPSFCPYGGRGDRLWVREPTEADEDTHDTVVLSRYVADKRPVLYSGCDDPEYDEAHAHWDYPRFIRPSIHMPRWASRITLEITGVRVERLHDISDQDAVAEGVEHRAEDLELGLVSSPKNRFLDDWQSRYGTEALESNPWVWVIEFQVIEVRK